MTRQSALKTLLFMSACVLVLLQLMSAPQARCQALCVSRAAPSVMDLKGAITRASDNDLAAYTC